MSDDESASSLRVDRWLWAARVFKTRSQAAKACALGHVRLNGDVAKASKLVKSGDRIEALTPSGPRIVVVLALCDRRGPAAEARTLYQDCSPAPAPRQEPFMRRDRGAGRPTKRERRLIVRARGG